MVHLDYLKEGREGEEGMEGEEGEKEGKEERRERREWKERREDNQSLLPSSAQPPNAHTLSYEGIVKSCSISREASYSSETDPRS